MRKKLHRRQQENGRFLLRHCADARLGHFADRPLLR
jgi:hypothetical protein